MIRAVWNDLRPFLGSRAQLKVAAFVLESLIAGLAEAFALVLVVDVAVTLAEGGSEVELSVPLLEAISVPALAALGMALCATLVVLLLHLNISMLTARFASTALRTSRTRVLEAYGRATWERQAVEREGSLQETVGNLALQSAAVVMQLSSLAVAAVGLVALLCVALVVNAYVTFVVVAFGSLLFLALRPVGRATKARGRRFVTTNSQFTEGVSEWGGLAMELRVYGVEGEQLRALLEENREVSRSSERSRFMNRAGSFLYKDLALIFLVAAIVGLERAASNLDLAAVGAVVLLIVRALNYAQAGNSALHTLYEQAPNLELLLTRVEDLDQDQAPVGHIKLESIYPVVLADVTYHYGGTARGISDVNLLLDQGEAIGVIGPSGGGKSTLTQLILGLRVPASGTMTANGVPQVDVAPDCWRRSVALVPQEPRLYAGSIAENITFFRPYIEREQVRQAAQQAHVLDDIEALPDGFNTLLGPRGQGLSGGQKQRVAIARALVGEPQLLVLDEPTSALDIRSEELLQETIHELKGRTTLVIVAHRLSTLRYCDRVVAVRDGRIEMVGALADALARLSFSGEDNIATG